MDPAAPDGLAAQQLGFRVKVCGVTRPADIESIVEAGAGAIGLNFSATSPRRIDEERANYFCRLARDANPGIQMIGVFVEQSLTEALDMASRIGLDRVQLHGDHDWTSITPDQAGSILGVLRLGAPSVEAWVEGLSRKIHNPANFCAGTGQFKVAGVLVDAYSAEHYGGTGQTVSWEPLGARHCWATRFTNTVDWPRRLPLVLAGGLHHGNIGEAIRLARPDCVDVASGVELAPGIKCPVKVRSFVERATVAFAEIANSTTES